MVKGRKLFAAFFFLLLYQTYIVLYCIVLSQDILIRHYLIKHLSTRSASNVHLLITALNL